jgi:hypothetical protein
LSQFAAAAAKFQKQSAVASIVLDPWELLQIAAEGEKWQKCITAAAAATDARVLKKTSEKKIQRQNETTCSER